MRTSRKLITGLAAVALGLPVVATPAQAQMVWNALPPMATPRNSFTLSALADGRLLAVGGWNGAELASCEIYDPATGNWSATGSLSSTRVSHTAIRLQDDRVLIAGGSSSSMGVTTVEIFDPATGLWTLAPPRVRSSFSVLLVLLNDGRVFLFGDTSTVAEIYDPATGLWSDTSTFGARRSYASATLLQDGRVLVAGGINSSSNPTAGLLYDADTDTWTPTAPHVTPRWMHSATALADGRVLILGGRLTTSTTVSIATAEVYDPASDTWTDGGAMSTSRISHTATLLPSGEVVVAGGNQFDGSNYTAALDGSELYDPTAGLFSPGPALGQARYSHRNALLPDGAPVVVGGYAAGFLSSAEVYSETIEDAGPPTVAITSPANGATLSGTVTITADAMDDTGVVSVAFYANSSLLGVDSTSPYQYVWNTALTYGGTRTLKARARDLANKTTDSALVTVTVLDITPPTVILTSPVPDATAPDPILLTADASDNSGVALVDFLIDGVVVGSVNAWPYQASVSASRIAAGGHTATARARDNAGNVTTSAPVSFQTAGGGGPTAAFDPALGAPACSGGSECDSGSLLVGRGPVGPEPNAPNTLSSTCPDGTTGYFHSDESLDRLRIRTLDGGPFAEGKTVEVSATVWAYSSYSADYLDVYYAPDASSPTWSLVGTVGPSGPGEQVLTMSFMLTAEGARQAIRGVFRFGGNPQPCTSGLYDDHDDLVFSLGGGGGGTAPTNGYHPWLQTPVCLGFGTDCSSGDLLLGRGSLGPEPNQPNTSFGECPDGSWGQFHVDASIDRIRVVSGDTDPLRRYGAAEIQVTVNASSDYLNERLDLFEGSGLPWSPWWQYLGSVAPTGPGIHVLSFSYTPEGAALTRAIRAAYRQSYAPPTSSCWSDVFNDHDDLWFRIDSSPGVHGLAIDGASAAGASGDIAVSYAAGGYIGICNISPGAAPIGLPPSCEFELFADTQVTLTPQPGNGSSFGGWSGACSGVGSCTLSMVQARQVGALFEKPFTLVLTGVNQANGVVDAFTDNPELPTIHCVYQLGPDPSVCEADYPTGTLVHLYVSPLPDSIFVGWSGGCSGTQPYCDVIMTDGLIVEAQFDGPRTFTVIVDGLHGAHGTIDGFPDTGPWTNIHCVYPGGVPGPVSCEGTYPLGNTVHLYAMPEPDSVFVGWSGACSGTEPHCNVPINNALTVQAQFDGPRTLTVIVDGLHGAHGTIDGFPDTGPWTNIHCVYPGGVPGPVSCEGTYPLGNTVHLYAMPEPDSVFVGWSGACSGTEPYCNVPINDAHLVHAQFDGPRTLTVVVDGANGAHGTVDAVPDTGPWTDIHCVYPGGVPGPVTCEGTYPLGNIVHLYAMAEPDSVFVGWSGACSGSQPYCDVPINVAKTAAATFGFGPQPVSWTKAVGVTASGNNLTKTAYTSWGNAGASSTRGIQSGYGYAEFIVPASPGYAMFGLSSGDADLGYSDIDYAFYPYPDTSTLYIYEKGVYRKIVGSYGASDTLRISVDSGTVTYWKNGVLLYTSSQTAGYPLRVDTALYSTGAAIQGATIAGTLVDVTPVVATVEPVSWTKAGGVTASGNNLTKTAYTSWGNAGASSTRGIQGGYGYAEFTVSASPGYAMSGLSSDDADQSYRDIDYAFYPYPDTSTLYIYEKGVYRKIVGSYAAADTLRISVDSGTVTYWKNGVLLYTSSQLAGYPLRVDTALYSTGAAIQGATIAGTLVDVTPVVGAVEPVSWTKVVGVSASGNNLTKTAYTSWGNAGASSTRGIQSGYGYAEFTVPASPGYAMFGLSSDDADLGYGDIDYAFYPYPDTSTLYIYEKGVYRKIAGSYAAVDALRITVDSGTVTYWKNGVLLYTSFQTSGYPLRVDTALYSTEATIQGATIAGTLVDVP